MSDLTTVQEILRRADELGIRLSPEGESICYAPKSAAPRDFVEDLRANKPTVLAYLRETSSDSERSMVSAVKRWADGSIGRWESAINALKRGWDLWAGPDSPRDALIKWCRANQRCWEATEEKNRLVARRGYLDANDRAFLGGREADIAFWGRLAEHLGPRAASALQQDRIARVRLEQLTDEVRS